MAALGGWIIAAFLGGMLLAGCLRKPKPTLRRRFASISVYRGLTSAQIMAAIQADPVTMIRQADGRTLMTWQDHTYAISLLFDQNDVCLGVEEEKECMP